MIHLCQCGCGQEVGLVRLNDRSKGWVKGTPLRFLKGHGILIAGIKRSTDALGNKYLSSHGYVTVNLGSRKRKYEHIIVAEKILGRPLKSFGIGHPKSEVVHHVRGNKTDQGNLIICTHEYHTALHHRLEQSSLWPEFPPVIRRGFGGTQK